ncbi:hypothetical protein NA57DRAFT_77805 [Rhizodiscina lignyota]|uniref:Uncharacterized protein n=1 Tax=Rhizodiscina lignyota TaxID=1504668 RepID=A0A9P4IEF7_9PEZI|nr:hypothetical protein NA57DRAFT_77805 [Rhizodiscina lignyota]
MSAPNAGRQSPQPEDQTGKQQQDPPAMDPNQQTTGPQTSNTETLKGLDSNPAHPLEKAAEDKTSKTMKQDYRNDR